MNLITSRAVIGMYYAALEALDGKSWVNQVSNYFTSDQASEQYPWLDQLPGLREWVGSRQAKQLGESSVTLINKHYEATIEIALKDLRRDKTGQLEARLAEFAGRGDAHFASLISTLIVNGESNTCYDGQFFFDTDHSEGDSGSQSNDITTDISALPAVTHGSTTAPSPEEMQQAILSSISQMATFVDDEGEPLNETAQEFLVMVPVGLQSATQAALTVSRDAAASSMNMDNITIKAAVNPRLTSSGWTDKFATFRTDAPIKALIRQEETKPTMKMKGEDSEFCFDNDAIQGGIDTWRQVGYGRWQYACLNQLV